MKVLIIEDEKAAVRNLCSLINEIDESISVIDIIDSVVDSVEWFVSNPKPDLVFMDIHLADGSAFDIFERCRVESPVIFTTAYDEYALKAFKVNSIDYVLKPIEKNDLRRAIEKFVNLQKQTDVISSETLNTLIGNIHKRNLKTHLLVPQGGDKIIPLEIKNIALFCIEEGVVRATTYDLKNYVIPHTLDQLADMLDPNHFFRANRQYIISKNDIVHLELWFGNRLSVKLKSDPKARVTINKPKVSEFKDWLTKS